MEEAIGLYLSNNGNAFVCPQYTIPWDPVHRDGGSCPDFVVLDFKRRDAIVVEVTTTSNLQALNDRILQRQRRWLDPLTRRLLAEGVINQDWPPIRVLAFVRRELVPVAQKGEEETGVSFAAIEDSVVPWSYWESRQQGIAGLADRIG